MQANAATTQKVCRPIVSCVDIENYPGPQVFKFLKVAVKLKVQIVTRTTRN